MSGYLVVLNGPPLQMRASTIPQSEQQMCVVAEFDKGVQPVEVQKIKLMTTVERVESVGSQPPSMSRSYGIVGADFTSQDHSLMIWSFPVPVVPRAGKYRVKFRPVASGQGLSRDISEVYSETFEVIDQKFSIDHGVS